MLFKKRICPKCELLQEAANHEMTDETYEADFFKGISLNIRRSCYSDGVKRLRADGCGQDDHSALAKYYAKVSGTKIGS